MLVVIVSFGGYQLIYPPAPETVQLPLVKDCPLHLQACTAKLPMGGEIHFDITPNTPDPTEELYLTTRFRNIDPDAVRVKFEGKTMNMGYLEYDLKQSENTGESVQYSGKGGLSVCIRGAMEWIVSVNVQIEKTNYEIPFEMETLYVPES